MPPSAVPCSVCKEAVYGSQKAVKCTKCGFRSHASCLQVRPEELLVFNASFICADCKKSRNENTPIQLKNQKKMDKINKPDMGENSCSIVISELETTLNEYFREQSLTRDTNVSLIDLIFTSLKKSSEVQENMRTEICILKEYLTEARNDLTTVKSMLMNIPRCKTCMKNQGEYNTEVSDDIEIVNLASGKTAKPSYATAVQKNSFNSMKAKSSESEQNGRQIDENLFKRQKTSAKVSTEHGGHDGKSTKVKPQITGTRKMSSLKTTKKLTTSRDFSANTRTIFVSRMDYDTKVQDVTNYLQNELEIKNAVVTRLKTKYTTYSSFHIQVSGDSLDMVLNPDSWPDGAFVTLFYGKLYENQKFSESVDTNEQVGSRKVTDSVVKVSEEADVNENANKTVEE